MAGYAAGGGVLCPVTRVREWWKRRVGSGVWVYVAEYAGGAGGTDYTSRTDCRYSKTRGGNQPAAKALASIAAAAFESRLLMAAAAVMIKL